MVTINLISMYVHFSTGHKNSVHIVHPAEKEYFIVFFKGLEVYEVIPWTVFSKEQKLQQILNNIIAEDKVRELSFYRTEPEFMDELVVKTKLIMKEN